ncbi:hypothetical protein [Roseobacter sp.]|uniref:hypothetical protein n=1 Tax=Roseobacter sp. TaxID=1907202 RepID=UPI003298BCA8
MLPKYIKICGLLVLTACSTGSVAPKEIDIQTGRINPTFQKAYFKNAPRSCVETITNNSRLLAPTINTIFLLQTDIMSPSQVPLGGIAETVFQGSARVNIENYARYIIELSGGLREDSLQLLDKLNRLEARCETDSYLNTKEDVELLRKWPAGTNYPTTFGTFVSRDAELQRSLRLMQSSASKTSWAESFYSDVRHQIMVLLPSNGGTSNRNVPSPKIVRPEDIPSQPNAPDLTDSEKSMTADLRKYRELCLFRPFEECVL